MVWFLPPIPYEPQQRHRYHPRCSEPTSQLRLPLFGSVAGRPSSRHGRINFKLLKFSLFPSQLLSVHIHKQHSIFFLFFPFFNHLIGCNFCCIERAIFKEERSHSLIYHSSSKFVWMYLKVESVSAVEIASTTSRLSGAVNPLSTSTSQRQGVTKIPVPLQHRLGGGAAAAAAVAAAASAATGASACTPDEIYCYTQSNSNINRTTSLPFNHHHQQEQYQYHHYYNQAAAATATTAALNRGFSRLQPPAAQHHYNPASAIANSSPIMGIHHIDVSYLFSFRVHFFFHSEKWRFLHIQFFSFVRSFVREEFLSFPLEVRS